MKAISFVILVICLGASAGGSFGQRTEKPVLHGREWVAITGKPLAATAGAMIFAKGGNAVDAACAMLAAVCTMYDVLSWGGETQALIYQSEDRQGHRTQRSGGRADRRDRPNSTRTRASRIRPNSASCRPSPPARREAS